MLTPPFRIRDKQAEIKLVQDQLLAPSQEIKDLELDEEELSAELDEETQKWHARWPEQEECCMILKLELSRVQAELDATYELVQKGIAKMEPPKADFALVDVPCATRPVHERGLKNKPKSRTSRKAIVGDLIAIEGGYSEEKEPNTVVTNDSDISDQFDFLTEYQDENQATCSVAAEMGPSDLLVDISTENPAKESQYNIFPNLASKCHDLSVLITDFPIAQEVERGDDAFEQQKPEIRDIADIVNVVVELMKKRLGSSNKEIEDEKSELAELNKLVHMMQPLYNIGLAIRKRQVEIDSQKLREEKDEGVILQGNSAAHHAQVLADATWMMDTPEEQRFKEMYNGVPATTVWENRSSSTFLDILNWNLNMRQFSSTGGIDRKIFDKLFKVVFPRIHPSTTANDNDFKEDGNLKNALAQMRIVHNVAYERQRQTREMNRLFLKNRRKRAA